MDISLLSEEVEKISKKYTSHYKIKRNGDWYVLKLQEEIGELIQSYLMLKKKARSKGKTQREIKKDFENEVADVFCHLLLLSKFHKVDLEKAIKEKWLIWNK